MDAWRPEFRYLGRGFVFSFISGRSVEFDR